MKYKAVIEIPKGCDRRIHLSYDGTNFIDLGLIKEKIPINNGVMPIHYGYIENTVNEIEKDNVDVIIFSNKSYNSKDKTDIENVVDYGFKIGMSPLSAKEFLFALYNAIGEHEQKHGEIKFDSKLLKKITKEKVTSEKESLMVKKGI